MRPSSPFVVGGASRNPNATLNLGSGISPAAWFGLAFALIALARVALGFTPSQWPSVASGGHAALSSEQAATGDQANTNEFIEWKAADSGDPHTFHVADLTLTLSTDEGSGTLGSRPKMTVVDKSGASISTLGQLSTLPTSARFGVGKIDSHGPDEQVLFLSYSGGAHCCTSVVLLERGDTGWRKKDLGSWDGEPLAKFPTDIDGDGVVDLIFNDERFAYVFAPYAMSFMPPRVFNVVAGRTVEVSSEPRYQKLFEDQLDDARTNCIAHNNGACAGYVALASRLGRRDEAWQTMLQSYDQTGGWSLPTVCTAARISGSCPTGSEVTFKSFPAALAWFLIDAGYPYRNALSSPDPNREPSFDCSAVTSVNLKLVCATPALSAADRDLASLYQADLSRLPDPTALQIDERGWIQQRNTAPPDIDLLQQMYNARRAALRLPLPQQDALNELQATSSNYGQINTVRPAVPALAQQRTQAYRPLPIHGYSPHTVGRQMIPPPPRPR